MRGWHLVVGLVVMVLGMVCVGLAELEQGRERAFRVVRVIGTAHGDSVVVDTVRAGSYSAGGSFGRADFSTGWPGYRELATMWNVQEVRAVQVGR